MKGVTEDYQDEKPPVLGTWVNIYTVVIGFLVFLIFIFSMLTLALR